MSKIQAIWFDFGGTLDDNGRDWFARFYEHIAAQCEPVSWERYQEHSHWAANHICTMEDTSELTMDQTVMRLCECLHERISREDEEKHGRWKPEQTANEFLKEARVHLERNGEVLAHLKNKFRLGCISNNWGNTQGWCKQFGFDAYFDVMIDSTRVGSMKPNRLIFDTALLAMGLPGERCVYVGDRYDCDVLGSRGAGMTPIWVCRDHEATEEQKNSVICIQTVGDLKHIDWDAV